MMRRSALAVAYAAVLTLPLAAQSGPGVTIHDWERGFAVQLRQQKDMRMYLWFYEWTLFDAMRSGQHTSGTYDFYREVSKDQRQGTLKSLMFHLTVTAVSAGADLSLRITNHTDNEWPDLAGIIPCFNPGRKEGTPSRSPTPDNLSFADAEQKGTYFLGPDGLAPLVTRAIHFNDALRSGIEALSKAGQFVFSNKWPTSPVNAHGGLIVRESADRKWVAGIAWEDYLSVQGHNPWFCMHHSVRVGPLKPGQSKAIRGKIYLFPGTKEDLLQRYRAAFPR